MDYEIRKMIENDRDEIISMMKEFYSSAAVSTNGSSEIFNTDFQHCICDYPYLEGYVFCCNENILGYSMIAKSFSTEFGKPYMWLEDLYVKPEYRGRGIIPKFIEFVEKTNRGTILRLESECENAHAIHVYEKCGFKSLPYLEMKKEV